jgi:hypothetical protein
MKPELEFLRKLETFLDQEFNEYSKNRILSYLQEFKDQIPPVIIKKERSPTNEIVKIREHLTMGKQRISQEVLIKEATDYCASINMELKTFIDSSRKKAPTEVVAARKEFCKMVLTKYYCSNNHLVKLFNTHHSTIVFYLHGKKYFKRQKLKSVEK